MKKGILKKSGGIATFISILTGITNMVMSFFGGNNIIGSTEGVSQSIPWLQTLLIMVGVFILVFVILFAYYFIMKKKIEEMPSV